MSEMANQNELFVGEATAPGEREPGPGLPGQLPDPPCSHRGVWGHLPHPLLRCQEESCDGITTITKQPSCLFIYLTKFSTALNFFL